MKEIVIDLDEWKELMQYVKDLKKALDAANAQIDVYSDYKAKADADGK